MTYDYIGDELEEGERYLFSGKARHIETGGAGTALVEMGGEFYRVTDLDLIKVDVLFDSLSPLTTEGDLLWYHDGATTRLPRGADGEFLVSTATSIDYRTIAWDDIGAGDNLGLRALTLGALDDFPTWVGLIATPLLGSSGTANSASFLRGDQVWSSALLGPLAIGDSASAAQYLTAKGLNAGTTITSAASNSAGVELWNMSATSGNFTSVSFRNSAGLLSAKIVGVNKTHGNHDGYLSFITADNGSIAERMRIKETGAVNIAGLTASLPVLTNGSKDLISLSGQFNYAWLGAGDNLGLRVLTLGALDDYPTWATSLTVGLGGTGSTSFTAGSVIFSNGSILTQDNTNFFYDDAADSLRVGPTAGSHSNVFGDGYRFRYGGDPAGTYRAWLALNTGSFGMSIGNAVGLLLTDGDSYLRSVIATPSGNLAFFTGGTTNANAVEAGRITGSGQRWLVGTPTDDTSTRLQVGGAIRSSSLTASRVVLSGTGGILQSSDAQLGYGFLGSGDNLGLRVLTLGALDDYGTWVGTLPLSLLPSLTSAELAGLLSDEVGSSGGFTRSSAVVLQKLADARGDLIAASGADAWARLALGASGKFLRSNGTDPVWELILNGDLGTGSGSFLTWDGVDRSWRAFAFSDLPSFTSAELAGKCSDEVGYSSGAKLLFNIQPSLVGGSASDGSGTYPYQILFGFNGGTGYANILRTRHSGSPTECAFDFFTNDGSGGSSIPDCILSATIVNGTVKAGTYFVGSSSISNNSFAYWDVDKNLVSHTLVTGDIPTITAAHTASGTFAYERLGSGDNLGSRVLMLGALDTEGTWVDSSGTPWVNASGGTLTGGTAATSLTLSYGTAKTIVGLDGSKLLKSLAVPTDGWILVADSAQTLGFKWASPSAGSSVLTTKGDLWGFSTVDARIPIGTNDKVLIADSTQTLGLRWDYVINSTSTLGVGQGIVSFSSGGVLYMYSLKVTESEVRGAMAFTTGANEVSLDVDYSKIDPKLTIATGVTVTVATGRSRVYADTVTVETGASLVVETGAVVAVL